MNLLWNKNGCFNIELVTKFGRHKLINYLSTCGPILDKDQEKPTLLLTLILPDLVKNKTVYNKR